METLRKLLQKLFLKFKLGIENNKFVTSVCSFVTWTREQRLFVSSPTFTAILKFFPVILSTKFSLENKFKHFMTNGHSLPHHDSFEHFYDRCQRVHCEVTSEKFAGDFDEWRILQSTEAFGFSTIKRNFENVRKTLCKFWTARIDFECFGEGPKRRQFCQFELFLGDEDAKHEPQSFRHLCDHQLPQLWTLAERLLFKWLSHTYDKGSKFRLGKQSAFGRKFMKTWEDNIVTR